MSQGLYFQIANFLYHEAYLLDHRKYKEWLDLLAEDLVYSMPVRITTDEDYESSLSQDMKFFEDTKASLTTRVNRLYTSSAWAEKPPTRQRHFISNIVVEEGHNPGEYLVRSYFLYRRNRGSDKVVEELYGERNDVLRNVNGDWKIASRTIYPDQAVLTVKNLSMFL